MKLMCKQNIKRRVPKRDFYNIRANPCLLRKKPRAGLKKDYTNGQLCALRCILKWDFFKSSVIRTQTRFRGP